MNALSEVKLPRSASTATSEQEQRILDANQLRLNTNFKIVSDALLELDARIQALGGNAQPPHPAGISALDAHPVGSIYMSVDSISPAVLFGGGTWERLQDRFLLAASDNYPAGSSGGEAAHILTASEMPNHTHTGLYWRYPGDAKYNVTFNTGTRGYKLSWSGAANLTTGAGADEVGFRVGKTGGGAAHNNMPPYEAVYMWKRTA